MDYGVSNRFSNKGIDIPLGMSVSTKAGMSQFLAYVAAVAAAGGTQSNADRTAALNLALDLGTDFQYMKRLNPFLGDSVAATVPMVKIWGPTLDILGGSGTTFDNLKGYTFSGAGYLRTGVIPSSASGFSSLDHHTCTGLLGTDFVSSGNKTLIGCNTSGGTGKLGIRHQATGPVVTGQVGLTAEVTLTASSADFVNGPCSGVWLCTSRAANDAQVFRNGVSVATDTTYTTDSKPTVEMAVGCVNANGAFTEFSTGTQTHYSIGTGVPLAAAQRITQAFDRFLQATGRCRTICFSGDSMSVLTGITDFPDRLKTVIFPGISTIGNGVGGTSSAVMLASQITDYANTHNSKWYNQIMVTFRNDVGAAGLDVSPFRANMASFVSNLGHTSFRIVQVIPQGYTIPGEYAGGANRIPIDQLKGFMVTDYGSKVLDDLASLQAANDGSANDLSDVANNICPRSLMNQSDFKHLLTGTPPPTTGNSVRALYVAAAIPGAVFS